jgi:hypothetical protein
VKAAAEAIRRDERMIFIVVRVGAIAVALD